MDDESLTVQLVGRCSAPDKDVGNHTNVYPIGFEYRQLADDWR
jgi:hypothetical protein